MRAEDLTVSARSVSQAKRGLRLFIAAAVVLSGIAIVVATASATAPTRNGAIAFRRYFNDAHIIAERNGPGILTNRVLHKDHAYPWVYQETVYDKITDTETLAVGFLTTEKSKSLIVGELQAAIRCRDIEIYDEATLKELQSFIQTETGRLEAEKGKNDDCVMSLALANHVHAGAWEPIEVPDAMYTTID